MKKQYIKSGICILLAAYAGMASAADLSELVVSAGRVAQDPSTVSSDVTVISAQDIEASQQDTVADILRSQAGIHVASSGGPGKATSVFLRGANSGQTLVLIDGVRVGSATLGSFDWANLSASDIERIEIVRGPQSSLYGADAIGGVIQIFTRKGSGTPHAEISAEAGGYGTSAASMRISGATGGVNYALSAEGMRTRGVSAAANGTEPDGYHRTTLSGRVGLPVGDGELELVLRSADGTTGLDGFDPVTFAFGDVLNYTQRTRQTVGSARLSYPVSDVFETSLQLSRSTDEVVGRDPAGGFNNADFRTRIDQLTWQNHVDLASLSLLAGVDYHKDSGLSGSAGLDRSVTQTAGFASLAWHVGITDLNGALRYDSNSATVNKSTYRLGVALHPVSGLKLSANYGTGFKAPSLNDLYFPAALFVAGNPNLKPETSKGWDLGLDWQMQSQGLQAGFGAVWFEQKFSDLIVWASNPVTFTFTPDNLNKARTRGLELTGHLGYGPLFLRANWTFLDARDTVSGDLLPRRARDSGSFVIGADAGAWHTEAQLDVVGPRFSSTGNTSPMAGYHTTSARLAYAVNDTWRLKGRVENLENKQYEEVSGYGVPGRAWYAGLSAQF